MPRERIAAAAAAGAAGVVVTGMGPSHGDWWTYRPPLPVLWLDADQWRELQRVHDAGGKVRADLRSQLTAGYAYRLRYNELDRVPARLDYRATGLATLRVDYHAQVSDVVEGGWNMQAAQHLFRPEDTFSAAHTHEFAGPASRTEYYNLTGPLVEWQRWLAAVALDADGLQERRIVTYHRGFSAPGTDTEVVHQGFTVPGQPGVGPQWDASSRWVTTCATCRHGDHLYVLPWTASGTTPRSGCRRTGRP